MILRTFQGEKHSFWHFPFFLHFHLKGEFRIELIKKGGQAVPPTEGSQTSTLKKTRCHSGWDLNYRTTSDCTEKQQEMAAVIISGLGKKVHIHALDVGNVRITQEGELRE